MIIAPAAAVLGTVVGVVMGLSMGYMRGVIDDILSRIIEALISLPVILVALLALTALSAGRLTIIAVIGFLYAPLIARTVRAAVMAERNLDYVRAAELRGENGVLRDVRRDTAQRVPHRSSWSSPFVSATPSSRWRAWPSSASGPQPGSPDWGRTIFEERTSLPSNVWWPSLFPALAFTTARGRRSTSSPIRSKRRSTGDDRRHPQPTHHHPGAGVPRPQPRVRRARHAAPGAARRFVPHRPRRVVRAGRRERLRQVDGRRTPPFATCRERPHPRWQCAPRGPRHPVVERERVARRAGQDRIHRVPGSRAGSEPHDPRRSTAARGVHGHRARRDAGPRPGAVRFSTRCRSPTPIR